MGAPLNRLKRLNTNDCLWIYILRILADKPMHAYPLRREVSKRYGFEPGFMTAYKVLYLLSAEGLVSTEKKARKQVYRVTGKGLKELRKASAFYKGLYKRIEVR